MKFTAQRGINLADIWVSESAGRVLWAALPVVNPGRTVLYFGTSATLIGRDVAAMDFGIETVCGHFAKQDIQLAQVLLDPEDKSTIAAYCRHQFRVIGRVAVPATQRSQNRKTRPAAGAISGWVNYSDQTHTGFAAAILASYEKSPGLSAAEWDAQH